MNDFGIAVMAWIFLVIAFVNEGLSHGFRWQETNDNLFNADCERLNAYWHICNVVFQIFLFLGIYFLNLGTDYSWKYTFDGFFWYDILWTGFHILIVRFSLFSIFNNIGGDMPLDYIGKTAFLDRMYWKYIAKWFKPFFVFILRVAVLVYSYLSITG
jgi:hypothetical protein